MPTQTKKADSKKTPAKSQPKPTTRDVKKGIFSDHGRHQKDTGSPEVQVAILTHRIIQLTEHLKIHKKDKHSRYGLLKLVAQRRKLLEYLKRTNKKTYEKTVKDLGLRK